MKLRDRYVLCATALLSWLLPATAGATQSLRVEVAEAAKSLKKFLAGQDAQSIAVGTFAGPPEASSGPLLSKLLDEELKRIGVDVKLRAPLIVEGNYLDVTDKTTKLLAGKLLFRVVTRQREELLRFERAVFGDDTLPSLFGITAKLPPGGDRRARDQSLQDAMDNPKPDVVQARIGNPGSPFAIEVQVKKGKAYEPRSAAVKEGLPFVGIQRGDAYAVRIINDAAHDVAVTLTIDGLNFFSFSDQKDYTVVLVGAKSSILITGWHRTNKISEEFLVTEYAKSAAAELKSTASLGTITACFAAAWPKDSAPPADEPKNPAPHSRSADATGRGDRVTADFEEVERVVGVIRATVSVRYAK